VGATQTECTSGLELRAHVRTAPHRLTRTLVRASDGTFFLRRRPDGMAPFEDRPYAWLREGRP